MKNEKKLNQLEFGEGIINKKDVHTNSVSSKNEKKLNQLDCGEYIVNKKDFHPNSIGSRIDLESLKKIMEINENKHPQTNNSDAKIDKTSI